MPDTPATTDSATTPAPRRRRAAGRPAGAPEPVLATPVAPTPPTPEVAESVAPTKSTRSRAKKASPAQAPPVEDSPAAPVAEASDDAPTRPARRRAAKATFISPEDDSAAPAQAAPAKATRAPRATKPVPPIEATVEAEAEEGAPRTRRRRASAALFIAPETIELDEDADDDAHAAPAEVPTDDDQDRSDDGEPGLSTGPRRRRRRGGRGRNRGSGQGGDDQDGDGSDESAPASTTSDRGEGGEDSDGTATGTRRRRKRRAGTGADGEEITDNDPPNTVVRVREPRTDGVRGVSGSTRLEAKRQRRKDSRDVPRRRNAPLLTEAEFLARREAVERVMLVRQEGERTQIAILEDGVLSEHYVTRASTTSYAGNIYLGKVQNVLVSMEAAFVDIGKGRNAVLYAGEVNYDVSALEGKQQRIEQALTSGQDIVVQVTKDPIGHKGARLTSQISLPGRFLVYVPGGSTHGISRKLPDVERARLKGILKRIVPEDAGVIIRTAAEGASEEDLEKDVKRLTAQWEDIQAKTKKAKAPALLYSEPDLVVRVVRDIFNEDFTKLVVQGTSEADAIEEYVNWVAPDLAPRLERWHGDADIFEAHRVDEQLQKALDPKVNLPSGGYLIIERTEAMTVIDVNTGKFVGKGGNLEETVTKNNLESAEEIVRQLRLRDIGGIIVIDFIDMVLESNRDLVLRRLIECLGRDRTKHNVAEVTSLGLVQMTRKRVGQGLLEAFSTTCDTCGGRGHVLTQDSPTAAPAKKGKGIPAGMVPKRTPVEDAIAAAAASNAAADSDDDDDDDIEDADLIDNHPSDADAPDADVDTLMVDEDADEADAPEPVPAH